MLSNAEITSMTAVVAGSLDQSLPLYHGTKGLDGYGHTIWTYGSTPDLLLACNIYKPTAGVLTAYADIIAGKRALMLRYMPGSDVREGDRIVYQGINWKVQPLETAESYTFANDVLITALT